MKTDKDLLSQAQAQLKNCRFGVREQLEAKIEKYAVATELSRGGDPERSRYWEDRAFDAKIDLEKAVGILTIKEADASCVGKQEPVVSGELCS